MRVYGDAGVNALEAGSLQEKVLHKGLMRSDKGETPSLLCSRATEASGAGTTAKFVQTSSTELLKSTFFQVRMLGTMLKKALCDGDHMTIGLNSTPEAYRTTAEHTHRFSIRTKTQLDHCLNRAATDSFHGFAQPRQTS